MLVLSGGGDATQPDIQKTVIGISAKKVCKFPSIDLPQHGRNWHTMDYDSKKEVLIICGGDTR